MTTNSTAANAAQATVQNGTPELSKFSVSKSTDTKPPKPKPEEKKAVPPFDARLKKFEELESLLERRQTVKEALQNVSGFYIAPTGSAHLKFTDSSGKSFGIAHPHVIGEMVHMAKTKLEKELVEIENSFDFSM